MFTNMRRHTMFRRNYIRKPINQFFNVFLDFGVHISLSINITNYQKKVKYP